MFPILRRQYQSWRIALAICAIAILATTARAEDWTPRRSFRTFSKQAWRGLPASSVMAMAQDGDGVMWIGTLDGVASFDGREITPVPATAGAPLHGVIAAIVPRKKGGVYVGTAAGVHLFDGRTWRLIASARGVASLAESRDDVLWMADTDGALWTLSGEASWKRRTDLPQPAVAIGAAPDGSMWAATNDSAFHLTDRGAEAVAGAPLAARPASLIVASDGVVWVATAAGTVHSTIGSDGWQQAAFTAPVHGAFRSIAEDRRGRIWAGSFGGTVVFGNRSLPWTVWDSKNGPFEAGVMAIMADREGSVWFGLNAIGLAQWIGEEWSHRSTVDPSNPSPRLFSAFGLAHGAAPGSLLVAVFNSGMLQLGEGPSRNYFVNDGLTEDVRMVVEPEPGLLLAGTRFGIFESRNGERFHQVLKLSSGFVMGFFKSPDGHWYAGTTVQGILMRSGENWIPVDAWNASLDNKHVRDMKWLRNGELWVATLRGITIFRDGAAPRKLTSPSEPAIPESVNAVLSVSDDEIWAGGTGGIAVRKRGAWHRMTESDGLPGQTIYSLAMDRDGVIWAGGSAGVGRYRSGRWTVWDSRAGLLQEECNLNGLLIADDGSVYISTMGGLAHFDPNVKPLAPPELKVTWRAMPSRDANGIAHLGTAERALHVRWGAAWLGPQPVQFRVRVPRLHDAWSAPTADDHLDIENLSAGDWRVEVQARVEGGRDWSAPLALDIAVAPYWYETIPGRLGILALLALAIYGAVRLRLRALKQHAAMLEATIQERTAQLAEKVTLLGQSEQRALAASKAKSAFLANMSHELRTPLNGVLGFAQLLARRKNRDAEDREGLDVIMKSGEHLLGLINDVLSLSKIEAGRVSLEESPFHLEKLIRDVEDVLRLRAEEKGLRLTCALAEGSPQVVIGDEGKLRQILINLLGNAVKFTQAGNVTMKVRWEGGRALFEVADTGPGIAADELPRLFEPFVQTDSGTRSNEGTGLGLALSRDLAHLMNGDITVESEQGRGSIFRLDVALREDADDAVLSVSERRRVKALAPGQDNVRILVVDDIAINRTVLSRLLLSTGFEVREAANGEDALAWWRDWNPNLIWMDKWMKGLDGLEVTRRIRAEEKKSRKTHVPILALSASALEQERSEILSAGCDDFVAKPFREATIFAKLREFLGVSYVYEDSLLDHAPSSAFGTFSPTKGVGEKDARMGVEPKLQRSRDEATHEMSEHDESPSSGSLSSGSVLLVDDDWICREIAVGLLRAKGFAVSSVASGSEALKLLESRRFDLVLMDVRMPGMDGPETARMIRATAGTDRMPIIAMTAESLNENGGLKATGMDDYIAKPVEPEALSAVLDRWMFRRVKGEV
jgi:signal transduction histidine kinase/CheY-like chemotaxis protein/ligand-binding sensor domain-containing protein